MPSLWERIRGRIDRTLGIPPTGRLLKHRWLSKTLRRDVLGPWLLDADSLNFLGALIKERRPEYTLEFGAGVSTICFARWMSEMHGSAKIRVFSIEQSDLERAAVLERLKVLNLDTVVRILCAPLAPRSVEGVDAVTYDLDNAILDTFLGGVRPSLVLVDGPFGEGLTRFATIPLVRSYLADGAQIFLDDKNRPKERAVIAKWLELPYIEHAEGGTGAMAAFVYRELV